MEQRLSEYRSKKQAEFQASSTSFRRPPSSGRPYFLITWLKNLRDLVTENRLFSYIGDKFADVPLIGKPFVLKVLLWFILLGLFIELEFGIVFVIISLFVIIYFNTSTKSRSKGEVSAYSVFNKDFKKIDGTFTAEQFEKELTHRM